MRAALSRGWHSLKTLPWASLTKAGAALVGVAALGAVIGARYVLHGAEPHGPMRWQSLQDVADPNVHSIPRLAVYSVPNIRPAHALPTLRDLGERAQVRAIDAIEAGSGHAHPWEDLRKALADAPEPGEKDPFLFERVLVATVSRGEQWLPGDRMVRTEIMVLPVNFTFAAYTIASTDTETVKVSSVEATDSRKLPSDVSLAFPGLGEVKVGGLPGQESSVKTTSEISSQFEQLGVDITPTFLRIIRESGVGGDVVGNTRIAVSMTTDTIQIMGADSNVQKPKDEIVLAVTGLNLDAEPPTMDVVPLVPLPHCALWATVSAVYQQRHILRGREFYDEALHVVRFVRDELKPTRDTPTPIAGADDVSPFVWSIQLVPPREQPDNKWHNGTWHALHASSGDNALMRKVVFSDYGRAVKMAHWIRTHPNATLASTPMGSPPGNAGHYIFSFSAPQFHSGSADYGLAVIKQTGDVCKKPTPGAVSEDHPTPAAGSTGG